MSLRDDLARDALLAMLARGERFGATSVEAAAYARSAYLVADAMIVSRIPDPDEIEDAKFSDLATHCDTYLIWPSEDAKEEGDYEVALKHTAEVIDAANKIANAESPTERTNAIDVYMNLEQVRV